MAATSKIRSHARAADGHEILLQVPMEPFDYPDNDPGPQTLLSSLSGEQNVDRLQWLMSRFHGYVGVMNHMGARFTASEQSLAPVLRETAKRGLIYADDGSSARSLASQIAGANKIPFAKADVIVDAVPTSSEIDKALVRLETIARERGNRDRLCRAPCRSRSNAWRAGPRRCRRAASCWCRSARSRTSRNRPEAASSIAMRVVAARR